MTNPNPLWTIVGTHFRRLLLSRVVVSLHWSSSFWISLNVLFHFIAALPWEVLLDTIISGNAIRCENELRFEDVNFFNIWFQICSGLCPVHSNFNWLFFSSMNEIKKCSVGVEKNWNHDIPLAPYIFTLGLAPVLETLLGRLFSGTFLPFFRFPWP